MSDDGPCDQDRVGAHSEALAGWGVGGGYRSGRNSWRGMPVTRSTASTLRGGHSCHWLIACDETPIFLPTALGPPASLIALLSAARSMADDSKCNLRIWQGRR